MRLWAWVTRHPRDAEARGIADGDIAGLFNDRGATPEQNPL